MGTFDLQELLSAFIVLFAVIDIFGAIPIILDQKQKGRKVDALRATVIAFALLLSATVLIIKTVLVLLRISAAVRLGCLLFVTRSDKNSSLRALGAVRFVVFVMLPLRIALALLLHGLVIFLLVLILVVVSVLILVALVVMHISRFIVRLVFRPVILLRLIGHSSFGLVLHLRFIMLLRIGFVIVVNRCSFRRIVLRLRLRRRFLLRLNRLFGECAHYQLFGRIVNRTQTFYLNVIFGQNINYFLIGFAKFFSYFIYSMLTHSSTSKLSRGTCYIS